MPTTGARRLRAGIVGTGAVAHLHAKALAANDRVELVGVVDVNAERAREFGAQYGNPPVFATLDELLDSADLDVVQLCTPPAGHAEQLQASVRAGVDVITEKPPALSLDEVDDMVAAARAAGRRMAVVFQQRAGSAVAHVKRLLDSGVLGRPRFALCHTLWHRGDDYYAVPWRGTWSNEGGGPTFGLGIHQIDLLAYLLGQWRQADGRFWRLDHDIEMEDLGTGTIVFESGVIASVVTTTLAARQTSSIRIDTELATIELEHLYGHGHANWRITPREGTDAADSWAFPDAEISSGHDTLLDEVYAALAADGDVPAIAAQPTRALEIIAAMYGAAEHGRPVARAELTELGLRGPLHASVETP